MVGDQKPPHNCFRPANPFVLSILIIVLAAVPLLAREKNHVAYGEGLIINIPLPETEVERVVADIAANGIIRGTKEYNKDEFVSGAQSASTCSAFPAWTQHGKVFYKVRTEALDPRGFKDSNDIGTLAVRYVVQPQGAKNTVLRIDALFKEDFKHTVHLSDGSVESNEYRDIQDHLDFLELMKKEDAEAIRERQEQQARKQNSATAQTAEPQSESSSRSAPQPTGNSVTTSGQLANSAAASLPAQPATSSPQVPPPAAAPAPVAQTPQPIETASATPAPSIVPPSQAVASAQKSPEATGQPNQTLEQRVKELRKQVERVVKSPGAPLKSAPFHTALNLQSLAPGTEVLILISTPYWYGVETHEGEHGWIMRNDLEQP
jgi:hypothetical protein